MFPFVAPFISFPPKTLASDKLLPSTLIVAFPVIVAEIVSVPFPPAKTFPLILIVFCVEGKSCIFTVTFEFIFPCELPP